MAWKNSVAINLGFWLYLLAGGEVYFLIENSAYLHANPKPLINSTFCQQLENSVKTYLSDGLKKLLERDESSALGLLAAVTDSCSNLSAKFNSPGFNGDGDVVWEYSSALFLCVTMLTTIGYGNYSPKTNGGKIFCILYGLIGIPICGIFLAKNTNYFSNIFLHLYEKQKAQHKDKRNSIVVAALVFLLPGLAVFLFVPSAIFMALENWNYLDAVYYSFVSLTTIGFGDVVAAQQPSELLWFYRICWIIWITLGIAYWAIIIGFIVKALKSKELSKRWGKTSQAIAEQAKEMRRSMERRISRSNSSSQIQQSQDMFLALKTKAVIEFAFNLTDSMANLNASIEGSPRPILKPTFKSQNPEEGFITMKELPTIFGRHKEQLSDSILISSIKEQEETSLQSIFPRQTLLNTQKSHAHSLSSHDSGFDDKAFGSADIYSTSNFMSESSLKNNVSNYRTATALSRENSRNSLPSTSEPKEEVELKKNVRWNIFARSHTRPELYRNCNIRPLTLPVPLAPVPPIIPQFSNLLMEAIWILQEAELTGMNISDDIDE